MQELSAENRKLITEKLHSAGICENDAVDFLICDLTKKRNYGNTPIVAFRDVLYVFYDDGTFFSVKYKDITDIFVENYTASGAIFIRTRDEEIPVSEFSLAVSAQVETFVANLQKLFSGESYPENNQDVKAQNDFSYLNNGRKNLFRRVLSYIPVYKKHLFLMVLIMCLLTAFNLIQPYLTGKVLYDYVLTPGGRFYGKIWELVIAVALLSVITTFLGIMLGRVGAELSGNIIYDIKTEVFASMQKLGMSFFTSKRTGNLLNRVNNDALDIQYFLNDGLPNFIINGATIVLVGFCLFITNPLLSVSVLIPIPVIILIIKKSARVFKKLKWHSWRKSSSMNSVINDTLTGIRVVKAFGKEDYETERFHRVSKALCDNRIREGIASARVFPLLSWIMTLGGMFVWGIGGCQVVYGSFTFGELMSFVGYLGLLYNPVNFMVKTFDWWTSCMNSAQRIFEVIDRETDVPEKENPVEKDSISGEIELRNVSFSYEPNKPVLKNISFKVNPGEMVGLVGHSGAGKSTITNIITRLYDVNDGEVRIDGINVKDIGFKTLRKNIGMVLQETHLFAGSIAENIAYGNPDATMEEIICAAKKAYAHSFIVSLPDGYDTIVGKNGVDLSGGEKQRISIARAILMDPAILIFDEATSSLDTKTEQQIRDAMNSLVKNRTTIAIAHRFSTLKDADRLIVVEEGRIVEEGTHEELFSKEDGIYSSMAKKQLASLNLSQETLN